MRFVSLTSGEGILLRHDFFVLTGAGSPSDSSDESSSEPESLELEASSTVGHLYDGLPDFCLRRCGVVGGGFKVAFTTGFRVSARSCRRRSWRDTGRSSTDTAGRRSVKPPGDAERTLPPSDSAILFYTCQSCLVAGPGELTVPRSVSVGFMARALRRSRQILQMFGTGRSPGWMGCRRWNSAERAKPQHEHR